MKPLVSILIPVYNGAEWISYTLQSAVAQTWSSKEIIVVDDGSKDQTAEVAQRFASNGVKVVSTENQGAAAARNLAFQLSQGDYIQWLDADDLLAADKIERQLSALQGSGSKRILLSCPWAPFYYRTLGARFVRNSLCEDLSPVEWLMRKMGENLYMQTATWLTSRELAVAAGPWDTRLLSDDDVEYFCRALLASEGIRFVSGTGVFYRRTAPNRLSYIGNSDRKKEALLLSMKLQISYLRSREDSERARQACLKYLQASHHHFYPERSDLIGELHAIAKDLQGQLEPPLLRPGYAWMKSVFGWKAAKRAQHVIPEVRASFIRQWEKAIFKLERLGAGSA